MVTPFVYQSTVQVRIASEPNLSSELNRVFAAAVINKQFCSILLSDPDQALQNGYLGETFSLSREERDLIVSIRAKSLKELAVQVNRSLKSS